MIKFFLFPRGKLHSSRFARQPSPATAFSQLPVHIATSLTAPRILLNVPKE